MARCTARSSARTRERVGLGFGHRDADAVRPTAVVAIEHVSEVHVHFTRKEEGVWRRECCDRTAWALGQKQTIGCANRREADRFGSTELMLLRMAAGVAPRDPRHRRRGKSSQSRIVLVRDRRLVGARNRVHLNEVRAAYTVNRRLPSKMPSFIPGNVTARLAPSLLTSHDEAENADTPRRISSLVPRQTHAATTGETGRVWIRVVPRSAARPRLEGCDLLGNRPALSEVCAWAAAPPPRPPAPAAARVIPGNAERRVPERVPLIFFQEFRRDVDAEAGKGVRLVVRHAADACRHLVLGREVLPEHRPLTAVSLYRQITNRRRAAIDRESGTQLRRALTVPRHREQVALECCGKTTVGLVLRHVALQRSCSLIGCDEIR